MPPPRRPLVPSPVRSYLIPLCLCGEISELLFSLRNLLSASRVFLLLAFNVRLCLFLHRLLAFVFWRFVAHEPHAKVLRNTDQPRDLALRPRPRIRPRGVMEYWPARIATRKRCGREYWSTAPVRIAPAYRVGMRKVRFNGWLDQIMTVE